MSHKQPSTTPVWLIVIIVLVIIIIFVATLGKVNPSKSVRLPEDFKDSEEEAKIKHERLKKQIEKQETLKFKLDKKFKRTYFFVRLSMVLLFFIVLGALYFFNFINNVSDAMSWSQAILLVIVLFNFITFGSITNLKEFIDTIKTKTENWIYGKHINLEKEIEASKKELENLEKDNA